ncbi:MAG: NAD(P)/FAD-dependent oxidoreductase [Immundisolibacteraceae bacterium]|nr:NAD(P)/FAD-dependent oxidoreductase [Immundisolibacteraceae bacterium]
MENAIQPGNGTQRQVDAVVIGAGFAGLYTLHCLRDRLGLTTQVYEAGSDVGGTWYWNRYPGARCDSESVFYMFSDHLSKDILQEWNWSERYAGQAEILRYLQFVADKMDLRRGIQFNTRVDSAVFDEAANRWLVTTNDGQTVSARYLITGVGCLSKPFTPEFKGMETFAGQSCHTAEWPDEGIDFTGKRVAVVGTGATAVQIVPEIAGDVEQLYVLQRTPSHDVPGRNHPLDDAYIAEIKGRYGEVWDHTRDSFGGFPFSPGEGSATDATPDQRTQIYNAAWQKGGLGGFAFGTFGDLMVNKEANDTIVDFICEKIHETVEDPEVAEALSPRYPFFTKRPPLEHGYYETFNQDKVTLVDVKAAPIREITPTSIITENAEYEVDIIIFATGFDAMTGALFAMDIQGRDGIKLQQKWAEGPRTYLGLATEGFPNMFMISGPQSPSVLTNMPVSIEQHVEWISQCIQAMDEKGVDCIEPLPIAEEQWLAHHAEVSDATLIPQTDSWWVGANVPGKKRLLYPYPGGLDNYRKVCDQVAENGYDGFAQTTHEVSAVS